MITQAQAETIERIYNSWGMRDFAPDEVFPARNNSDNAARRVCRTLGEKGLLDKIALTPDEVKYRSHIIVAGKAYRYSLNQAALDEFHKYAATVDYEFPW